MTSLNMKIVTNNRPSEFLFLQVTQQMRLLDINTTISRKVQESEMSQVLQALLMKLSKWLDLCKS